MEEDDVIRALAALGQSLRLKVFRALIVAGKEGLTPGVMGDALEVPAATLSFHLKELAGAGLVTQERASRHLIYRADFERMNALVGFLTHNCCQGEACLPAASSLCSNPGNDRENVSMPSPVARSDRRQRAAKANG